MVSARPRFAAGRPAAIMLVARHRMPLDTAMGLGGRSVDDPFAADVEAIAAHGDQQAFARLFDHFAPRVKAYLLRLGVEAAVAEELMQEVMLTVWRRADSYNPALAAVSTWIFTIARNRRIDARRRDARPEFDPEDPALAPDPPPAADAVVATAQFQARLAVAIDALPAEQAQLVRLSFFEDKSHGDIAADLRLPLGTVKSRLRIALARLRTMFEPS